MKYIVWKDYNCTKQDSGNASEHQVLFYFIFHGVLFHNHDPLSLFFFVSTLFPLPPKIYNPVLFFL